jgi:hypothetical protein
MRWRDTGWRVDFARFDECQRNVCRHFPFLNNTNFNTGPNKGTQDILNVEPMIPIHINEDWNVITRTILPLIWQPSLQPAQTVPFGKRLDHVLGVPIAEEPNQRLALGGRACLPDSDGQHSSLGSNVWGAVRLLHWST